MLILCPSSPTRRCTARQAAHYQTQHHLLTSVPHWQWTACLWASPTNPRCPRRAYSHPSFPRRDTAGGHYNDGGGRHWAEVRERDVPPIPRRCAGPWPTYTCKQTNAHHCCMPHRQSFWVHLPTDQGPRQTTTKSGGGCLDGRRSLDMAAHHSVTKSRYRRAMSEADCTGSTTKVTGRKRRKEKDDAVHPIATP
ncbi:hypothetical protein LX36DRAFT_224779 [Colletotrichum falcatum]|nr:hypothetical protein LX36DRAFT_224779 [Colletotrichum falcatum]